MKIAIEEFQITLVVPNLRAASRFYREELGLDMVKEWCTETGSGIRLRLGTTHLELIDEKQADSNDWIEAGKPVNAPVRLRLQVKDASDVAYTLLESGSTLVAPPIQTPFGEVARMEAPDGTPLTFVSPLKNRSWQLVGLLNKWLLKSNVYEYLSVYR